MVCNKIMSLEINATGNTSGMLLRVKSTICYLLRSIDQETRTRRIYRKTIQEDAVQEIRKINANRTHVL